jgi:hypothetical protein
VSAPGGVESPAHLLAIESHVPLAAGVRLVPAGLVRQYVFNNRYSQYGLSVARRGPRSAVSVFLACVLYLHAGCRKRPTLSG